MRKLQGNYPGDDQYHAEVFPQAGDVSKESDAYKKCSARPDTRPYSVRRADRDLLLRQPKQRSTDYHGYYGQTDPKQTSICPLGQFKTDRPTYFK